MLTLIKIIGVATIIGLSTAQTCYEQAPFECPEGTYCTRYSDGCNTCECADPDAATPFCTLKYCRCYDDDSCVPSCMDNEECMPIALAMEQVNSTQNDNGSHNTSNADMTSPPTDGTNSSSPIGENILRVLYQFGFFDGSFSSSVTEASLAPDIPGLMCQIQGFFTELLRMTTGSSSLYTQLTEIDWEVAPADVSYPVLAFFTVEFYDETDAGQAELSISYAGLMREALQGLDVPDRQNFITQWLWESQPVGRNFFASTNSLGFFYQLVKVPVQGQLDLVDCGDGIRV
jgi:hypothetical protein